MALPLFALTNAYRYVRICVELVLWWELSSRAMKVLFERYIFTRQTADGKHIWTDRAQEKDNKDVYRNQLGKNTHVNHEAKMVRCAALFNENSGRRNALAQVKGTKPTKPTDAFNESEVHTNHRKIFAEVYIELRKMRVYAADGKVKVGGKKGKKEAEAELFQSPTGKHLNASLLNFVMMELTSSWTMLLHFTSNQGIPFTVPRQQAKEVFQSDH